ncbi:transmembrane protein 154 isoform 1-T1 [Anableps anableps]
MSLLDNMRGPRLKTPLLFLLLLLSSLTGTAFCQEDDTSSAVDGSQAENTTPTDAFSTHLTTSGGVTAEDPGGSGSGEPETLPVSDSNLTDLPEEEGSDLLFVLIPVALVIIIIGVIVCGIVIWRSKKAGNQELSKEDPHLDGFSTEKVPMPMFEEDVPSVLELEMEELDQWMKKDS